MFNTDRVLTLQSSQVSHSNVEEPNSQDILRIYLYGNDPNGIDGGLDAVRAVDRLELRFYCPRWMLTDKPGAKYRLRLERIAD